MSHPQTNCEIYVIEDETNAQKALRIAAICEEMARTLPLRIAELRSNAQHKAMMKLCSDMDAVTLNP